MPVTMDDTAIGQCW